MRIHYKIRKNADHVGSIIAEVEDIRGIFPYTKELISKDLAYDNPCESEGIGIIIDIDRKSVHMEKYVRGYDGLASLLLELSI